jgi:hypothetical protein
LAATTTTTTNFQGSDAGGIKKTMFFGKNK